jgi:hypothetical protein
LRRIVSIILIFLFNGVAHADIIDDCAKETGDPAFADLIEARNEILNVLNRKNEIEIEAESYRAATVYLSSLPKEERKRIVTLLEKWQKTAPDAVNISGVGKPIIFVHGIEDLDRFPFRWVQPLHEALKTGRPIKLFSWYKGPTLDTNAKNLIDEIRGLLDTQKEDVDVIAYSAGGAIAIKAQDYLTGEGLDKRVKLNTIASPIYGYGAPLGSYLGVPVVGFTTIEIGRGTRSDIQHKLSCTQWVTVDPALDRHARINKDGTYPQQGPDMPCSDVRYLTTESHLSSLPHVTKEVLRRR